jgi:hypothetical protein
MKHPILSGIALAALSATACAQSRPVTGTIVRPSQPAAQPASAPQSPAKTPATVPPKAPPKVEVSDQTTKLEVGSESYVFVKRVHDLKGEKGLQDSTTEWWELRDASGKVVSREDYGKPKMAEAGGFEETNDVTARAFKADGGSGVLVEGMVLPSAPNSGTWVQVFAHPWGPAAQPLKSFGPPVSTDGEFTGIGVDHRRDPPAPPRPGVTVVTLHDVMKFRVWTGNFDIEYPVLINWITGRVEPAMRCYRGAGNNRIERCAYSIHVDPSRDKKDLSFVRLFVEPEEGFGTPQHVVIKPESKIEFLSAEVPVTWQVDAKNIFISPQGPGDSGTWIKVRIDGKEGWIHTQEDFLAVGLPQSG